MVIINVLKTFFLGGQTKIRAIFDVAIVCAVKEPRFFACVRPWRVFVFLNIQCKQRTKLSRWVLGAPRANVAINIVYKRKKERRKFELKKEQTEDQEIAAQKAEEQAKGFTKRVLGRPMRKKVDFLFWRFLLSV